MIDELMDSLLLDQLPISGVAASARWTICCRGAEDVEPILHSFKNSQHLRVGVRDILGKDDMSSTTHRALVRHRRSLPAPRSREREYATAGRASTASRRFVERRPATANPASWSSWRLGKLGGREPNYHSDLDVVFLYEADGATRRP